MAKARVERGGEDLLHLYLTDIGQYPLLTKDDEVRLAQAIEAGVEAREGLEKNEKKLNPTRKRQQRRSLKTGEDAGRASSNRTCDSWYRSRRSTEHRGFRFSI